MSEVVTESPRFGSRRMRVAQQLADIGAQAFVVTDLRNIAYLSGFNGSAGVLVLGVNGEATLCTDSRYELQVRFQAPGVAHIITRSYLADALGVLNAQGKLAGADGGIAIEAHDLTLERAASLRAALDELGTPEVDLMECTDLVEQVRRVKDAKELEQLKAACEVANTAWTVMLQRGLIRAGRAEREVAADLEHAMRQAGSDGVSFETIVASGPNGALPHHVPGNRVLVEGDLVVVDFGALVGGYASDCTRTVAIGEVSGQLAEIYHCTLEAQLAGVEAARPGVTCADLDAVSRSIISDAGYGEFFGHSLGHGVGLNVHEAPSVSASSTSTLLDGDVITVEPGIYLPGRGGVRIEDTVAVTAGGHQVLTTTSKDLVVC